MGQTQSSLGHFRLASPSLAVSKAIPRPQPVRFGVKRGSQTWGLCAGTLVVQRAGEREGRRALGWELRPHLSFQHCTGEQDESQARAGA